MGGGAADAAKARLGVEAAWIGFRLNRYLFQAHMTCQQCLEARRLQDSLLLFYEDVSRQKLHSEFVHL